MFRTPASWSVFVLWLWSPAMAAAALIQPGSPLNINTLPAQVSGAPAATVLVQEPNEPMETGAIVSLGGSFASPVNLGDVVLCDGAALADHTGCAKGVLISDVLRFTHLANPPRGALPIDQYELFSDPFDEKGLDVKKLPGGKLLAPAYYITEKTTNVDVSKFVEGLSTLPVVVYKANDGMGNVNTYLIASDEDIPEPSTLLLLTIGMSLMVLSERCLPPALRSRIRPRNTARTIRPVGAEAGMAGMLSTSV